MSDFSRIEYEIGETHLGWLLLAATPRGVCLVRFGCAADALRTELAQEFPFAPLTPGGAGVQRYWGALERCARGLPPGCSIPLDVAGSRFQQRVWQALRRIPRGETRSYARVARAIGRPEAARAVAQACAANPVPLVVPCHRVVRSDGGLGGYALGVERKRELLDAEGALGASRSSGRASARSRPGGARPQLRQRRASSSPPRSVEAPLPWTHPSGSCRKRPLRRKWPTCSAT